MTKKLGLRPGDPTRPAVRLKLAPTAPAHPTTAEYASQVPSWGMLGNDQYGDCGPAGMEHQRMQVTRYLASAPYVATEADTLAFYKLCDPGFDPATDAGDDGVILQDMLGVAAQHGVGGSKPVCFAKVDHTNLDEVRAAIAIFGSVLFGITLQTAQQSQQGTWDYSPSSIWGGHCVLAVSYSSYGVGVVTWGETLAATNQFLQHQLDEAWVVIWPEHLGSQEFLAGVDVAALAADYTAITGRPFPAAPTPTPTPVPPGPAPQPVPASGPDGALVAALNSWAAERHSGANKAAAKAFLAWKAAKGL